MSTVQSRMLYPYPQESCEKLCHIQHLVILHILQNIQQSQTKHIETYQNKTKMSTVQSRMLYP
jgi:hypothetical protein